MNLLYQSCFHNYYEWRYPFLEAYDAYEVSDVYAISYGDKSAEQKYMCSPI